MEKGTGCTGEEPDSSHLGHRLRHPRPGKKVVDFRKLDVWRRSQALAVSVYRATDQFPRVERFRLTVQMRRAALSVSSNLAEGCGRRSDPELRRYIRISLGSLSELECQVRIACELELFGKLEISPLLHEIQAIRGMLEQLHKSLRAPRL